MDRAEKIDLLRAAQRLAAVSKGKISADNALKELIRTGLGDDVPAYRDGALKLLTQAGKADDLYNEIPGTQFSDNVAQEIADTYGQSENEFRTYMNADTGEDDYRRFLRVEDEELNRAVEVARDQRNKILAEQLLAKKVRPEEGRQNFDKDYNTNIDESFASTSQAYVPEEKSRQRELAAKLIAAEEARRNPYMEKVNDIRAKVRYEQALRANAVGERTGEIAEVILPGVTSQYGQYRPEAVKVTIPQALLAASGSGEDTTYVDKYTGEPLAQPYTVQDAPKYSLVDDFIDRMTGEIGPRSFSPQVNIGVALDRLNDAAEKIKGDKLKKRITDKELFKEYAQYLVNEARRGNVTLRTYSENAGKPVNYRGDLRKIQIEDILTTLNLGPQEQKELGYALGQIAKAENTYRPVPKGINEDYVDEAAGIAGNRRLELQRLDSKDKAPAGFRIPTKMRDQFPEADSAAKGGVKARLAGIGQGAQQALLPGDNKRARFNNTGETDPGKIREYLEELARSRNSTTSQEGNIKIAQDVARRAAEANTARAERMDAIIRSLPPNALKENIDGVVVRGKGKMNKPPRYLFSPERQDRYRRL